MNHVLVFSEKISGVMLCETIGRALATLQSSSALSGEEKRIAALVFKSKAYAEIGSGSVIREDVSSVDLTNTVRIANEATV
jgi:hypothetical protein